MRLSRLIQTSAITSLMLAAAFLYAVTAHADSASQRHEKLNSERNYHDREYPHIHGDWRSKTHYPELNNSGNRHEDYDHESHDEEYEAELRARHSYESDDDGDE
jgi:hypothetical protein